MSGWNLKLGELKDQNVSEEKYWSLFNFVFSNNSKKRNTYKFGLIKAILDNLFNGVNTDKGIFITYYDLFAKFTENYWNLIVKYDLRQMRKDRKSEFSKIEVILKEVIQFDEILKNLEFQSINLKQKEIIIKKVNIECKRCVLGALYEDFEGTLYSFVRKGQGLYLSYKAYEFMLKYKLEIEKLNYYAWAKFLEKINSDKSLVRVIDKLELATPKRKNMKIYREVLKEEFQECRCFYCGKKLSKSIHVDHVIPWSFIKDNKIWNLVLTCSSCNKEKTNKVPNKKYIFILKERNKKLELFDNKVVKKDFKRYSENLLEQMWEYAKMGGIKEYQGMMDGKQNNQILKTPNELYIE